MMSNSNHEMENSADSLVGHLTALKSVLVWSLVSIGIGFLACWGFSDKLFDIIRGPIQPFLQSASGGLVFTAPMDKFLAHIKVSLLGGTILTAPLWIFQIWRFIAPALYRNEKKYGIFFICGGSVLFLSGVSFVYFVVYPMAFEFLMNFGGSVDSPLITIGEYLSFFVTTTLVFGLAFEMPLIFSILGIMGVVEHQFLRAKRRYAIVLLAALSAIVTPPDVISMGLMMLPMILLYELSIICVKVLNKPSA